MVVAYFAFSYFVGELVFIYFNMNKVQVAELHKDMLHIFVELMKWRECTQMAT